MELTSLGQRAQGGLGPSESSTEAIFYHYVIIRNDLPIGAKIAQTIHAAGESANNKVLPKNTHAIALSCQNENELLRLEFRLNQNNIEYVLIREPDAPYNGEAMAIGICPQPRTKLLKKLLSNLPLIK